MNMGLSTLFWALPYPVRRALVRVTQPAHYRNLQRLRAPGGELHAPDRHRCIFVHIPKCAGMSVRQGLFGDRTQRGHFAIRHYMLIYPRQDFDAFFKFAFVRNPWSRLFSAYTYMKQGGGNAYDQAWAARHLGAVSSFEEFVLHWVTPRNVEPALHFRPQCRFLCRPGNRSPLTNFIGFYESLAEDFEMVRRRLGVSGALAHVNRTGAPGTDYRDHYTDAMVAAVAEVYREDIATLGYTFDNSSLARQRAGRAEG
jgi:hypothetical protein